MNLTQEDCDRLLKKGKHYPLGVPGYNPKTQETFLEGYIYLTAVKLKEAAIVHEQKTVKDHGKAGHKGDYLVYNPGNGEPFYFIMDKDEFIDMYPKEKKTKIFSFLKKV